MKPDALQIGKLPKWAQDHIHALSREREEAIRALNKATDSQTPSAIFVDEYHCTGEKCGPTTRRRYFQGHNIEIEWEGVWLSVYLAKNDPQQYDGINIQWGSGSRRLSACDAAFIPRSYQAASITTKDKMR